MAKLIKVRRNVNPFSGIYFCAKELTQKQLPELITKYLGKRVKQAKYSFADNLLGWLYCNLCNGDRLEDGNHLKQYFKDVPNINLPSPDILGRTFKDFATPSETVTSKAGKEHQFNINMPLNGLMVETALTLKQIDPNADNVLDYDNMVVPCQKKDASWTFKHCSGYQPGIAFIGETPVYIEGRSGHSNACFDMATTLTRCLDLMAGKGVKVKRFRSDSASYQKTVVALIEEREMEFFIRMNDSKNLRKKLAEVKQWDTVTLGKTDFEITELKYTPFQGDKEYRIIITRYTHDKGSTHRAIITNNTDMTKEEVLAFYNMRGAIERNFDELGNSFNWKRLPFSFLDQNTAFMIIGAICSILYKYILRKFSKKLDFLKPNFRLKNFILYFISVSGEWGKVNGEDVLTLYMENNDRNYEVLME